MIDLPALATGPVIEIHGQASRADRAATAWHPPGSARGLDNSAKSPNSLTVGSEPMKLAHEQIPDSGGSSAAGDDSPVAENSTVPPAGNFPAPGDPWRPVGSLTAYILRTFQIESDGDPDTVTGSNRGLAQFGPEEERRFGITDANRADPEVQGRALVMEANENLPLLTAALDREPNAAELYLAHQQGVAGAVSLLSNPDVLAWKAIRSFHNSEDAAKLAISENLPRSGPLRCLNAEAMKARDFIRTWIDIYNRTSLALSSAVEDLRLPAHCSSTASHPGRSKPRPDAESAAISGKLDQRRWPLQRQVVRRADVQIQQSGSPATQRHAASNLNITSAVDQATSGERVNTLPVSMTLNQFDAAPTGPQ